MKINQDKWMGQLRNVAAVWLLCVGTPAAAETWIDVTDIYVMNPRYDNNDFSYWEGTGLGAANPVENAEHYQRNFNTYQMLTGLKPGRYRLSLDAFYRMGSSADDYSRYSSGEYADWQKAQLYATSSVGDYYVPIAPSSSAALKESLGGGTATVGNGGWQSGNTYYIPNNMEAAHYWFEAGYYDNSVECEVGDDGLLTIGIRKDVTLSQDWTCIDNWKLEYYGELIKATAITLSATTLQLAQSETHRLTATVSPADATYQKVEWTSLNEKVATVSQDGVVTAVGVGTTTIRAKSVDGSTVTKTCRVTVYLNEATAENVIINEVMASNVDVYMDPSRNYGPWVELYNPTDKTVTLGGLYVSDDPANLRKYRLVDDYGALPAHGFALLNFDHFEVWTKVSNRQIDGTLECEGGTVIISNGTGILAQQDYPRAISRTSWARIQDGGEEWGTTGNPTPGESNAGSIFASQQLAAPVVDTPSRLFTGNIHVNVTIPEGARLRFTTDGTTPTLTNGSTSATGVFRVAETTCLRLRLFQDGKLPSPVVTRSYIYDNGNEPFPIISVVTADDHLWSTAYGVFATGPNGRPGNGQSGNCNWNMAWDRPVSFDYITTDGECGLSQECDLSTCGGWSRAWSPHAFKLKANKVYELQNSFDYQFFAGKPYLKHKTLQIRNGGNDTGCRIKDAGIQGVVESSGIYVDYQSWQPVHVYFNGTSYAVLNMREPNNKHFARANYGLDNEEMDQFEISPDSGYVQMVGTNDSFERWYELAKNSADTQAYGEICGLVDIDEYINYMAIELYTGNTDWPQNNVKGFRAKRDGKFHFVLFDLDGSFSTDTPFDAFFGKQNYTFDMLYGYDYSRGQSVQGNRRTQEIKFVTIFRNMLRNEQFKKRFVDAFCLVAGSVFTPELTRKVISERADYLASGGYVNPYNTSNTLISSFANRQGRMISNMNNSLGLNASSQIKATLGSNISEAELLLNGQPVPTGSFSGTLYLPVSLKAVAPAGYKFVGWMSDEALPSSTVKLFDLGSAWNYYDGGSLDKSGWQASGYSVSGWSSGATPIGYDYNNQHPELATATKGYLPTYYFRKNVNVSEYDANAGFTLDWVADDGFIVYVNGVEAGRYNMPSGSVGYSTFATTYAPGNPDRGTMQLDGSLFRRGTNTIAVEMHNNSGTSSDIYWNASLSMVTYDTAEATYLSTDPEYTLQANGSFSLQAVWEPMADDEQIAAGATPLKVNEVSAGNTMYVNEYYKRDDWIELYNTSVQAIDLAGMYLSDDVSEPQKYQVPESDDVNTVVEPGGHFVVWASGRPSLSQLHAPFKLGNATGELVVLTAEDGSWADTLEYVVQGEKQSVGLYPDGGQDMYLMDAPTIGKQNAYTSNASLIGTKPYATGSADSTFRLELAEGWNWTAHPLRQSLSVTELQANAERIVGQQSQYLCDAKLGWVGQLSSLEPARGYKLKMSADMEYTYTGPFFDTAKSAVSLKAGWNWIGYPLLAAQSVATALDGLIPAEGDILVGQNGVATYENGRWDGSLQVLRPGTAYLYKSADAKAFRYHVPQAGGQERVRARFDMQPRSPWTASVNAYPNVMNIIARVKADGIESTALCIGAFDADGTCRGVGKYVGDLLYLTIHGDQLENIFLRAADPHTGLVADVEERFFFDGSVMGSRKAPLTLNVGRPTDIASVKYASAVESATYYTPDGREAGCLKSALGRGTYIAKYRLADGSVLTKKLIINK